MAGGGSGDKENHLRSMDRVPVEQVVVERPFFVEQPPLPCRGCQALCFMHDLSLPPSAACYLAVMLLNRKSSAKEESA
jgi:hypothetical protein